MPIEQLNIRDLIPVGVAVGGYIVGTLHTTAANLRERRQALHAVIYSLLEVRWQVKMSNPAMVIEVVKRALVERFGQIAGVELAKPEVQQFFRQLVAAAAPAERDGIGKRYSDAVESLAPFYPILAHQLSSESILRINARVREHYERLRQHPAIAADPLAPASLAFMEDHSLTRAFAEAEKSLSEDLEQVGRHCWLPTRLGIRRAVNTQNQRFTADAFYEFLKATFDPLLSGLPAVASATPA